MDFITEMVRNFYGRPVPPGIFFKWVGEQTLRVVGVTGHDVIYERPGGRRVFMLDTPFRRPRITSLTLGKKRLVTGQEYHFELDSSYVSR